MRPEELLTPTPSGVCCQTGGFHIDPTRPVDKAVITHGHSDHARAGPRRGAGDAGDARHDAAALRREFRRFHAGAKLRRDADARRREGDVPSGRPRARLGAGRGRVQGAARSSPPATTRTRPIRPARRSSSCPATCSSPRRRSACRCSATAMPSGEIAKLLHSVALFPERAHLVGAYSLGKAQRVIALIRKAGYDKPIYLHGAMEKITRLLREPRHRSRRAASRCAAPTRPSLPAPSRSARRRRCRICGRGAFPIRCRASPPAGCGCARARASAASNCRW